MDAIARKLHEQGVSANLISLAGFALGCCAAILIVTGNVTWALLPLLLNRLCDGVDGAIARFSTPTDRGAFLDITLDFLFYASIPLAFALCEPDSNALSASALLASFIGTGVSFLAYAIIAEKRGEKSESYPNKAFYYLGGLTEGSETIACFVLMCLWPQHFAVIAYAYAAMCSITTVTRMLTAWHRFKQ